jgi:hypothetical protein
MVTGTIDVPESAGLRPLVRDFLERDTPVVTTLTDPDRTDRCVAAFDLPGLLVPAELGGAAGDDGDALVVLAEAGAALLGPSALAPVLVGRLLRDCPEGADRDTALAAMSAGRLRPAAPVWLGPTDVASFQAVKHTCATMHVNTVEAQALADRGAQALRSGEPIGRPAAAAKALASEAFLAVSRSAIEVHGGVGFAWEHPAQLFFKRALADAELFGAPDQLYDELYDTMVAHPSAGPVGA